MITQEKLAVYRRFAADIEGLERVGNEMDRSAASMEDLALIERLLRGLKLCNRRLADPEFCAALEREIRESCDTPATVVTLVSLMYD